MLQRLVNKVLRQLANHGCLTWGLFAKKCGSLANARRIQVVEAVAGAFLPVEFFYDGLAPITNATLCARAVAELTDAKDGASCASRDNNQFTCPTEFWSFNRVIERREHQDLKDGKMYELSEPSLQRTKIDVLTRAVVATSSKVGPKDANKLLQLVTAACGSAIQAQNFDELAKQVQVTSPTLIILLPHSLRDPNVTHMAALELGKQIVNSAQVNKQHVLGPKSQTGPAVLLLGCSTELAELPYQTFVERFKAAEASLVLATMSPIRGQHAVRFVERFLKELKSCIATGNSTFGDALLHTKREMLASGDPFVLTLVAYGDAEWLI